MKHTLPPDKDRRRGAAPDLGPPIWLKAIVIALGAASFELTAELALLGPEGANPWVSVTLLCLTYLGVTATLTIAARRRPAPAVMRREEPGVGRRGLR